MGKLTLDMVKMTLLNLAAHYPEAGHNGQTIAIVSEDYLSDLDGEGVTEQQFVDAVNHSRKNCGFFPKIKDLLDSWRFICANPPKREDQLQIADTSSNHDQTPEEKELSEKIKEIAMKAIRKEITFEESISLQEELISARKTFTGRLKIVGEQQ